MACRLCCIKLSLAVRVIAMVGLITSMLVLTQLATETLFLYDPKIKEDKNEEQASAVSILLGLDLDEISKGSFIAQYRHAILMSFLCFALVYAVASALLVWGSIVESQKFAWPWLTCEAVSFATQILTLAKHGFKHKTTYDKWIILLSVANMCLSVYFWIVVFMGQRSWARAERERKENETVSTTSSVASRPPTDIPERV